MFQLERLGDALEARFPRSKGEIFSMPFCTPYISTSGPFNIESLHEHVHAVRSRLSSCTDAAAKPYGSRSWFPAFSKGARGALRNLRSSRNLRREDSRPLPPQNGRPSQWTPPRDELHGTLAPKRTLQVSLHGTPLPLPCSSSATASNAHTRASRKPFQARGHDCGPHGTPQARVQPNASAF